MKRGLVAATSAAILLGASMIWKQFVAPRPETTVAHAAFDKFGRLAAYPGKEKAACPQQSARTAVVFAIGQSNIGNFGAARLSTAYGARVVNFFDGACWIAGSPLYGADQTLGEALTPLGDPLGVALLRCLFALPPLAREGRTELASEGEWFDVIVNIFRRDTRGNAKVFLVGASRSRRESRVSSVSDVLGT